MSNATVQQPKITGMQMKERVDCPQCQSPIPVENIYRRTSPGGIGIAAIQTVKCQCDHCGKYFKLVAELHGGVWNATEATVIAARDEIDSLNRVLDALHGTHRVLPPPPADVARIAPKPHPSIKSRIARKPVVGVRH